eukprot:3023709-Rhodomonas_salina.1
MTTPNEQPEEKRKQLPFQQMMQEYGLICVILHRASTRSDQAYAQHANNVASAVDVEVEGPVERTAAMQG